MRCIPPAGVTYIVVSSSITKYVVVSAVPELRTPCRRRSRSTLSLAAFPSSAWPFRSSLGPCPPGCRDAARRQPLSSQPCLVPSPSTAIYYGQQVLPPVVLLSLLLLPLPCPEREPMPCLKSRLLTDLCCTRLCTAVSQSRVWCVREVRATAVPIRTPYIRRLCHCDLPVTDDRASEHIFFFCGGTVDK